MSRIKRFLLNVFLRYLMRDFTLTEYSMRPEETHALMLELYQQENFIKFINIQIGDKTRKHLYVKSMEEKAFYSGQVAAFSGLRRKMHEAVRENAEIQRALNSRNS